MSHNLVITGMGAITPIGHGVKAYWDNLIAGKSGIRYITHFDSESLPVHIAGEVTDFDGAAHMPRTVTRSAAPFMQFAFAAAAEAMEQARLENAFDPDRTGVCMGTALAGVTEISARTEELISGAASRISPHFVPRAIGNMACAHAAISYGFTGPSLTISTACSAGGDALMAAAMLILAGDADAILVIAGESAICPTIVSSLAQAKALSRRNDAPKAASRPFDKDRDGFVIGEGGGALVLETEASANRRKAPVLARLAGWGNTMDAWHITAPDPCGAGAAKCMRKALSRAGMRPEQIGYINAHGTSTQLGDQAEILAMQSVFGDAIPPVSSTKGATGHLMGAGGLTEVIACIKAIETGILPPTLNLNNPDSESKIDFIAKEAREARISAAMSNALGFGGQNSSIIVTAPDFAESI